MRLHFQDRPWDLYAAVVYAVVMAAVLLAFNVGSLSAILLLIFVPGYVLVAALFPGSLNGGKHEIKWIERIALSFGLSIAVVPVLGLVLDFTPWGIRFAPSVLAIALFTVGVGYAAFWRRMRLPAARRLSLTVDFGLPEWREYSAQDKLLTIALAMIIVVVCGTLSYVVLVPRPGENFTEFYILGPDGNASGYSTALNVSEAGTAILGIANHEFARVNYSVRIDLVGVLTRYNSTSGFNETVEVSRTMWSLINVSLANGQEWTQPYTFRIDQGGLWKVQFLLFKNSNFSDAYREVHFFIRVT